MKEVVNQRNVAILKAVVHRGWDIVNAKWEELYGAFYWNNALTLCVASAYRHRTIDMVAYLIEVGVDLEHRGYVSVWLLFLTDISMKLLFFSVLLLSKVKRLY